MLETMAVESFQGLALNLGQFFIMKICILNSRHAVSDTRVKRIIETLAEAGNEVLVLAPSFSDNELAAYPEELNLSFICLNRQARGDFEKGLSAGGIFKTFLSRISVNYALLKAGLKAKADVYHCNEVDSWGIGILLSILVRSKVVFDVHEYYPARVTDVITGRVIDPIAEGLSRFLFQFFSLFSDGLIFVNQSLVDLYRPHGKTAIVRNCVRKSDFTRLSTDEDLKKRYQNRIIVLHIGSLREQYGPQALLDSLDFIKDPRVLFLILGGVSKDFLAEAEKKGFADQVETVEQLPFDEMLAYLAVSDIGITPLQPSDKNTYYSLARKFLEYVAAGIPVIVSDFPEYRSLVEKYELGLLIDPENPREIAAAVNRLVEDQQLRVQLGENAARAFEKELNWEMESRKLFDLYDVLRV